MDTQQMYDTLSSGERQALERMVVEQTNAGMGEEKLDALFEATVARFYEASQLEFDPES